MKKGDYIGPMMYGFVVGSMIETIIYMLTGFYITGWVFNLINGLL